MEKLIFDKKYAEMSWLEQASELVECPEHDFILSMPDEIEVSNETLSEYMNADRLNVDLLLDSIMEKHGLGRYDRIMNYMRISHREIYSFEMSDDFIYSYEEQKITSGRVHFKKCFTSLSNPDLIEKMANNIKFGYLNADTRCPVVNRRIREIFELVDQKESQKSRQRNNIQLCAALMDTIADKITKHEWRIRSSILLGKIIKWTTEYAVTGQTYCIVNLTKLKLSTYQKAPIYSIPEEEV